MYNKSCLYGNNIFVLLYIHVTGAVDIFGVVDGFDVVAVTGAEKRTTLFQYTCSLGSYFDIANFDLLSFVSSVLFSDIKMLPFPKVYLVLIANSHGRCEQYGIS